MSISQRLLRNQMEGKISFEVLFTDSSKETISIYFQNGFNLIRFQNNIRILSNEDIRELFSFTKIDIDNLKPFDFMTHTLDSKMSYDDFFNKFWNFKKCGKKQFELFLH